MDTQYQLMANNQENRDLFISKDKCDKYDYLVAVACGAIGGIIDVCFVGSPTDSKLCKWTDAQVDNAVMAFAKRMGWSKNNGNVKSAIGWLEKKYSVNYDQRHRGDVFGLFNMMPKNHHMKSLAHSPDIIGLFFSVLNQFTSTASFLSDGQIIHIKTDTFELHGDTFIAKIFCGIANWFGHLMSDVAGASGSVDRGSGIVIPFYELFGFCKFGKFNVGKDKQDLATIATRAFQEGYDFRFGMAQTIPVAVTDLLIRLIWALRQHFQYGKPIYDCIPSSSHDDLRIMLLIGNGVLCVCDAMDAGLRSGGNYLMFFLRLNLIAWVRLVLLVLKEVFIRIGLRSQLTLQLEAIKRTNAALAVCLAELEKIDIELYKQEVALYHEIAGKISSINSETELNNYLMVTCERLGIAKPWEGDFDTFMSNRNNKLIFRA